MLKASGLRVDAIVLDLEDSVPAYDKETARWLVKEYLNEAELGRGHPRIFVRINGVATGLYKIDLEYVVSDNVDGIIIPKAESGRDIKLVESRINEVEGLKGIRGRMGIIPIIETVRGIMNIGSILDSSNRIIAVSFGAADYCRDLGVNYNALSLEQYELIYPRSVIALNARLRGMMAIDTPFMGLITDLDGLEREAWIGRRLGFNGKYAIHPSHIDIINRVYTPSKEEVREARDIVTLYESALREGRGVAVYDGRMIDEPHYRIAKKIIEFMEELGGGDG